MTLPFKARFIPTDQIFTVEAVTDISIGRLYWVRSKHGELVSVPASAFVPV